MGIISIQALVPGGHLKVTLFSIISLITK
jgi:hypothetical protein